MSVGAGTGHVRAAAALEQAFTADPRVDAVVNQDALTYTNRLFRDFYSRLYTSLAISAPNFLGWWYKASDEPWRTDAMRHMLDRLNTRPLVRFIRDFDPHLTVCTHFMPAGIISHLIATRQLQAKLSIVVTDFDFHAMWLSRAFQRYFVAIDETRAYLRLLGIPANRITVSGIPIDKAFGEPVDRVEECRRQELHPGRPVLLLSAGAGGMGPTELMVESLLTLDARVQTIVVCGKNEDLARRLTELTRPHRERFRILGYTDEMHRLMKIADILIAKPGGMTSAEALASGLPLCIVHPIPGQEERNSDHLLERGAAIRCHEPGLLAYKLQRLLDEPRRLEAMRANALALARPRAALTVAHTLLGESLPPHRIGREPRQARPGNRGA